MNKKYVVSLTKAEQAECLQVATSLSLSSQKARRALILLKVDVNGAGWTDEQTASAYHCSVRTVANVRKRFIDHGFTGCLNTLAGSRCPKRLLDGRQEAKIIALRLGDPPAGFYNWSLRLLAQRVVALEIVDKISHETCRQTLKKTA